MSQKSPELSNLAIFNILIFVVSIWYLLHGDWETALAGLLLMAIVTFYVTHLFPRR